MYHSYIIGDRDRDRDRGFRSIGVRGYLDLDLDLVEEGGAGDRWCPSMVGGVVGIATGPIIQGGEGLSWVTTVLIVD